MPKVSRSGVLLVPLLVALAGCARRLPSADPSVFLVRSYGSHRVIVERVCNPAHCTTRTYLEAMSDEYPARVLASAPVVEANVWWAFVDRIEVVPGEHYGFDLYAIDTHGSDAGFTFRVTPLDGVRYQGEMRDVRSGGQ